MSYSLIVQYKEAGEDRFKKGDYAEAEKEFVNALKEAEQYDYPNEYLAQIMKVLGVYYLALGEFAKAETYFKESLAIQKSLYGLTNLRVAQSMTHLGLLYHLYDKYSQAENVYREALKIETRTPYLKYPEVDKKLHYLTLHLLAMVYCAQNKRDQALALCQKAPVNIKSIKATDGKDLFQALNEATKCLYDNPESTKWILHEFANQLQVQYLGAIGQIPGKDTGEVAAKGSALNQVFDILTSFDDVWRPWELEKEEEPSAKQTSQPAKKVHDSDDPIVDSIASKDEHWRP